MPRERNLAVVKTRCSRQLSWLSGSGLLSFSTISDRLGPINPVLSATMGARNPDFHFTSWRDFIFGVCAKDNEWFHAVCMGAEAITFHFHAALSALRCS